MKTDCDWFCCCSTYRAKKNYGPFMVVVVRHVFNGYYLIHINDGDVKLRWDPAWRRRRRRWTVSTERDPKGKKENEQDDGEQEEDEVAPRSRVVASWVWDLVIPVRSIILLVIRASHLWTHGGPYLRDFSESVAARSYMAPLYFSTPFSASSAASGNSAFEMQWTGWGVQCNTLQCFNSHELCQKWRIFDDCSGISLNERLQPDF